MCEIVNVCVKVKNGGLKQLTLFVVPLICEPLAYQPVTLCQDKFKHLKGLPLADPLTDQGDARVDILIGADQYWNLVTGRTKRGKNGPMGIETHFGWVLSGPARLPYDQASTTLVTHTLRIDSHASQDMQSLDDRLKSFWDLESFGIIGPERSVLDEF